MSLSLFDRQTIYISLFNSRRLTNYCTMHVVPYKYFWKIMKKCFLVSGSRSLVFWNAYLYQYVCNVFIKIHTHGIFILFTISLKISLGFLFFPCVRPVMFYWIYAAIFICGPKNVESLRQLLHLKVN